MKKLVYTGALALLTLTAVNAQEDKISETTTKRITVKSSLGNETVTKTKKVTATSDIKLDPADAGQVNQSVVDTPFKVRTEVTYSYDNADFTLEESEMGYTVMRNDNGTMVEIGNMRRMNKQDVYMMKTDDGTISMSYFDENNNLVTETYNSDDDTIKITKWKPNMKKTSDSQMKKY